MKKTAKFLDAIGWSMQAFFVHEKKSEISHQISSILEYPDPFLQLSSKWIKSYTLVNHSIMILNSKWSMLNSVESQHLFF